MAGRKQFQTTLMVNPELETLLAKAKGKTVPEDVLREQRVSFAFGNAPANAELITKDSVRYSSEHIRLAK